MYSSAQSSKSDASAQALALLPICCKTDRGLASLIEHIKYQRIEARNGIVISQAVLLINSMLLQRNPGKALESPAQYRGIHQEISVNIDTEMQQSGHSQTTGSNEIIYHINEHD
jgi:hypothetical protein